MSRRIPPRRKRVHTSDLFAWTFAALIIFAFVALFVDRTCAVVFSALAALSLVAAQGADVAQLIVRWIDAKYGDKRGAGHKGKK